jgi:hypothetical protein
MKPLIVTTALVLFFFNLHAQKTNLILFAEGGEKFTLQLNGVIQNSTPQSNVKVEGLQSDAVQAIVVFEAALPQMKQLVALEPDQEMTFVIRKGNKGNFVLRLISTAPLNQQPTSTTETFVVKETVPANSTQETTSIAIKTPPASQPVTNPTATEGNNTAVSISLSSGMNSANANISIQVDERSTQTTGTATNVTITEAKQVSTTSIANEKKVVNESTPTTTSTCTLPMLSSDFDRAKESIEAKSFPEEKLTICKQLTKANCFDVKQVISLMELFTYEENKLDIAKLLYSKTVDKGNYYQVNDALTYSTSVDELNKFLEKQ